MWVPRQAPFFSGSERSVEEAGRELDTPPLLHVESEGFENVVEDTASHPILKAAMAGLVRRVLLRQIPPLSARPERPENTFKDTTVVLAGTAAGLKARDRRNKRGNNCPLRIGDEHWGEIRPLLLPCSVSVYFETGSSVTGRDNEFERWVHSVERRRREHALITEHRTRFVRFEPPT